MRMGASMNILLEFRCDTHGAMGVLWEVAYYLDAVLVPENAEITYGNRRGYGIYRKRYNLAPPYTREKVRAFITKVRDPGPDYPTRAIYEEFDPSYVETALATFDLLWPVGAEIKDPGLTVGRMIEWLDDWHPRRSAPEELERAAAALEPNKVPEPPAPRKPRPPLTSLMPWHRF
jgi:hypothetical protein